MRGSNCISKSVVGQIAEVAGVGGGIKFSIIGKETKADLFKTFPAQNAKHSTLQ